MQCWNFDSRTLSQTIKIERCTLILTYIINVKVRSKFFVIHIIKIRSSGNHSNIKTDCPWPHYNCWSRSISSVKSVRILKHSLAINTDWNKHNLVVQIATKSYACIFRVFFIAWPIKCVPHLANRNAINFLVHVR